MKASTERCRPVEADDHWIHNDLLARFGYQYCTSLMIPNAPWNLPGATYRRQPLSTISGARTMPLISTSSTSEKSAMESYSTCRA
jgi:hypothetical protein